MQDLTSEMEEFDEDLLIEEITRLITEGFTSGILDDEMGNRTTWKLTVETYNADKDTKQGEVK